MVDKPEKDLEKEGQDAPPSPKKEKKLEPRVNRQMVPTRGFPYVTK